MDQGALADLDYSQNAWRFPGLLSALPKVAMPTAAKPKTVVKRQLPPQVFWLKLVMMTGFGLLLFGHYLWVGLKLPETMGVPGIIIVAGCCAFGLILSLPTKIYLTLLLMQRESAAQNISQPTETPCNSTGSSNNDAI